MSVMSHASPQFHQLQMFATPKELQSMVAVHRGGNVQESLARSAAVGSDGYRGHVDQSSYLRALASDVEASGGVDQPLHVWHGFNRRTPVLLDGRHRAAVAIDTNRLVPVVHHADNRVDDAAEDAFNGSQSAKGW